MSTLFFRVSWQHNIDRFRGLQKTAHAAGYVLTVKNASRSRTVPCFLFYLKPRKGDGQLRHFYSFDGVDEALRESTP